MTCFFLRGYDILLKKELHLSPWAVCLAVKRLMELANRLPRGASSKMSRMFPCSHVMRESKTLIYHSTTAILLILYIYIYIYIGIPPVWKFK